VNFGGAVNEQGIPLVLSSFTTDELSRDKVIGGFTTASVIIRFQHIINISSVNAGLFESLPTGRVPVDCYIITPIIFLPQS